jgi:hypothetical protein
LTKVEPPACKVRGANVWVGLVLTLTLVVVTTEVTPDVTVLVTVVGVELPGGYAMYTPATMARTMTITITAMIDELIADLLESRMCFTAKSRISR